MPGRPGMQSDQTHAGVQNSKTFDSSRAPHSSDAPSTGDQSRNPPWIGTGIYIGLQRGRQGAAS